MTEAKVKDVKIRGKAIKKPSQMEELLICQDNISRLGGELGAWQTRYSALLDTVIATNPTFTKTKMQEKKGSKSDTYKVGKTAIIRTPMSRRVLRFDEIRKTFPDFIKAHGTVALGTADRILGAETVAKFCDVETSYRYEVQSLKTANEKKDI